LQNWPHRPSERLKLLQGYFEPTEEERNEGKKSPTLAHRSIADLVAKGNIRVVVTTNFDRLLEQALSDAGVPPTIITSPGAANGALPLAHAKCTIIKVHGDYLDPRFKNTLAELESYEAGMDRMLDQVFDEYGLIVCGWSADWDPALRKAIERCPNRRFTTYWAARGEPSSRAQRLIDLRQGVKISISGADEFFGELCDRVTALESFTQRDPLSVSVAIARTKRYLSEPRFRIALNDLVVNEISVVRERISDAHFPTSSEKASSTTFLPRLKRYDTAIDLLLQVLICITYWGDTFDDESAVQGFRRIAEQEGLEYGMHVWLQLKRYPALLLLYGVGIAASMRGKYGLLKQIFEMRIMNDGLHKDPRVG
jgi:hypothetical protein